MSFDVEQNYSRENFNNFLFNFLPDDFEPKQTETSFDFKYITNAFKLGSSNSLNLDVFEFETKSKRDPRVTLTREVVSCMKKYGYKQNALVVFYSKHSPQWRLSLITTDYEAENGKVKPVYSNPKRFSFMLGEGCKKHTPETMLSKKVINLADLKSRFDIEVVTKEFYNALFNWYEWALDCVTFPTGDTTKTKNGSYRVHQSKEKNELNLIRLITRFMFVWFIKQKDLIPAWIFDRNELNKVLADFDPESTACGNYYNAIIQNLFFATLNKKIEERAFADDTKIKYNKQFGVKNYYRDNAQKSFFRETNKQIIERFISVPFLNGGLFECLDSLRDDKTGTKNIQVFTDGFTRVPEWMAFIPNQLFWHADDGVHEGLINILNRYNFTVEENTPADVQVALDPELLGKVFENLLGTYNPETKDTARKSSGSFYTPRIVVHFMIDEALKNYLQQTVKNITEKQIAELFNDDELNYRGNNAEDIVHAIKAVTVLDPACGSGAFPMGMLQRMVHLIKKCNGCSDDEAEVYRLKLQLIENCLYGVDIQPIAVQICKLRFFISLICEQTKTENKAENYGFNPLPNLETKFVAADSLIGKNKNSGLSLMSAGIEEIKNQLQAQRHAHFTAQTAEEKACCRQKDKELRNLLANQLEEDGWCDENDAKQLAAWNPYDQNAVSPFFDAEWMFNIKNGFDIVIGNPPYIQLQDNSGRLSQLYKPMQFKSFKSTGDIYQLFYERGISLLKEGGHLVFITSNKWMRAGYGETTRKFFAEHTQPKLLIDLAGEKVFVNATVDVNILLLQKGNYKNQTLAAKGNLAWLEKRSDKDILHNTLTFPHDGESWVILSEIEQSIKKKIEAIGTPLKDWNVNIYRGILTGCNEAFIIDKATRDELIQKSPKSADIIRPILRGRDIKRYSYDFADLYLINTHNGIRDKNIPPVNVNDYPAIKAHLDTYWDKISVRDDQGETPYNLRNCAYMEDFSRPKIIYAELAQGSAFILDKNLNYMILQTGYIIVGDNLEYLLAFLNSKLIEWAFRRFYSIELGNTGLRWLKQYVENLPIPVFTNTNIQKELAKVALEKPKYANSKINDLIYQLYGLTKEETEFIKTMNYNSTCQEISRSGVDSNVKLC